MLAFKIHLIAASLLSAVRQVKFWIPKPCCNLANEETTREPRRRRAAAIRRWQEIIDQVMQKVINHAEALKVPANLRRQLIKKLGKNPSQPWDEILKSFLSLKQIKG